MPLYRCLPFAIVLLSGCVSLSDFQTMSAHERAFTVCELDYEVRSIRREIAALDGSIQDAEMALGRGYRVHEQCREVEVYGNATQVCEQRGPRTVCTEHRPVHTRTECLETPVSLNLALEKENIQIWSQSKTALQKREKSLYQACYDRVYPLSPEQAYLLYR